MWYLQVLNVIPSSFWTMITSNIQIFDNFLVLPNLGVVAEVANRNQVQPSDKPCSKYLIKFLYNARTIPIFYGIGF